MHGQNNTWSESARWDGRGYLCVWLLAAAVAAAFLPVPQSVCAQGAKLDSIRQAIASLREDDTVRVALYVDLAGLAMKQGNLQAMSDAVHAAVRTADAQGRPFGRAKSLVALGIMQTMQGDVGTGITSMKKGIAIYRELGEKLPLARALYNMGARLTRGGRMNEALDVLRESESLLTQLGDSAMLWNVWNVLGMTYHDKGSMKEASSYFARCLSIAERKQDKWQTASSLMNLANTLPLSEHKRAIAYYRRSEQAFRELGDRSARLVVLQAMGVTFKQTEDYEEARQVLEEAWSLAMNDADSSVRLMITNSLALVYNRLGLMDLAIKNREQHLLLSRKLRDTMQVAMSLVNVAQDLNAVGKFAEAEAYLLEACAIFEKAGEKSRLIIALDEVVVSCEGRGDSTRAYAAFRRRTKIAQETEGVETRKHIDELAMKYDAEHRENQITLLEKEKHIQNLTLRNKESELERQRLLADERQQAIRLLNQEHLISELELDRSLSELSLQKAEGERKNKELVLLKTREDYQASLAGKRSTERNALIAGVVLLFIIGILAIRRIQGHRREAALRAEAAEAESLRLAAESAQREHSAQQEYTRQLIHSQEQERQRIAQELHDSLSQSLLVIRNRAMLGLRGEKQQVQMEDQLRIISDLAAQSVDEVRAISSDLRPSQLDRLGLTETIRWTLESVASSSDIAFTADVADIDNLFPPESEIAVYRIIQEAVNNVLKHSGAREAIVAVTRHDHTVRISITDDGRGFDAATAGNRGGMGMRGMTERVRMLGGRLSVQGDAGRGTSVRADLPVTAVPAGEGPGSKIHVDGGILHAKS